MGPAVGRENMIRTQHVGILALVLSICAGAPVHGQPVEALDRLSGKQLQTLMQRWGYRAELSTDSQGDPKISTAMSGAKVAIYFYGCRGAVSKTCSSIQIWAGFAWGKDDPSLQRINEWNQSKRWLKAYMDKDGDPNVEYDLLLDGGVPESNLKAVVEQFERVLGQFMSFIRS